jgi:hypothetical protein
MRLVLASDVLRSRDRSPWGEYLPRIHTSVLDPAKTEKVAYRSLRINLRVSVNHCRRKTPSGSRQQSPGPEKSAIVAPEPTSANSRGLCTRVKVLPGWRIPVDDLKHVPLGGSSSWRKRQPLCKLGEERLGELSHQICTPL